MTQRKRALEQARIARDILLDLVDKQEVPPANKQALRYATQKLYGTVTLANIVEEDAVFSPLTVEELEKK